jgi:tripartite-type tricarboxylate transporter receptor subunit TctC
MSRIVKIGRCAGLAVSLFGGLAFTPASTASAQEPDLSGKTVEFVIPFAESGGSAQWANFLAPLLSQHLPGKPTVVVRYRPGAGSTAGANWFQQQKTADGTLVFGPSGSTQFPYLLGDPRVRYEYKDWKVVLASGTGGVVYLPPNLGKRFDGDVDDLKSEKFLYGSQGATTLDLVPLLAFKLLGLKVDPVFGVTGRGDGRLMFERGEANIDYQTSSAYIRTVAPLVEQKLAVPIFTFGALDAKGNVVRDPTFPDLPSFKEVCEKTAGCETSGTAWEAYKAFFVAGFPAQKLLYLPGTAPPGIVDMYTKAINEIIARPDFAKASAEVLGDYPQATGEAAVVSHNLAITVTPEAKKYVLDWLRADYGVTLK